MSLPTGARFAPGEVERIEKALADLAKEHEDGFPAHSIHAARELSVKVVLHVHSEYPKLLYKGQGTRKSISVASEVDEKAAREDGYGDHVAEVAQEG